MRHPMSVPTALAAPLVVLAALAAWPTQALAADDCLAAPNGATPKGQHWYYHLDRKTGHKCWYLRPLQSAENKPAQAAPAGSRSATAGAQTAATASAHSAQASAQQDRAQSSPPQPVRASSARNAGFDEPAQPRAVEQAGASPAPQDSKPAAAPASDFASDHPAPATTILWPDPPPPAPKPQQADVVPAQTADAVPGQTTAAQDSSTAAAPTAGNDGAVQGENPNVETTAAEPAPGAEPTPAAGTAPVTNASAPPAEADTSTGAFVENALVITLAVLLAGLVFAIAVIAGRRVRVKPREFNSYARFRAESYRPYEPASELLDDENGVRYAEAQDDSLVPEQVTMPRPFPMHGWQRPDMQSRYSVE